MTDAAILRAHAVQSVNRKRLMSIIAPLLVLVYFVYIFFSFDILGLSERARLDNAKTLLSDVYSYKTHVTKSNRGNGDVVVEIEGEKKGRYPQDAPPEWVKLDGDLLEVDLPRDHVIRIVDKTATYDYPGYGTIGITVANSGITLDLPTDEVPDFISASKTRVTVTSPAGRLTATKSKFEVFRYFGGWELFFFTLDSPFYGKSFGELASMALSGDRVNAARSNLAEMANEFWNNAMWRHKDVAWALVETLLMAFLGTVGAALIALPFAFMSAKNFTPAWAIRFGFRRLFDFLRGVDGLIWTIVLSRAFGPGPLTGALAILLTDTGTFGKMFSEALENVDQKPIEGIQSTGARTVQKYRFGVIPQITPIFVSQVLYYLESNTRSATVIGAIVGGGIGLMLTQAIITGKDWEEVTYYIVLIVLMVMAMDSLSGWLRRKLIGGREG